MNMKLKDALDKYCAVFNLECGYYYGISTYDTVEDLYEKYNIDEEYPEAFEVEPLIHHEILDSIEDGLMSNEKLIRIMNNLGISEKSGNMEK